jgi:hypothetical protein
LRSGFRSSLSNGALGDRFQKLRRCLCDATITKQHLPQGLWAIGSLHFFVAARTNRLDEFLDQRGIVRRPDRHRIADLVTQSPAFEIDLEMSCVLFRAFAAQCAIDDKFCGKRILSRVRRSRRSWLCGSGFGRHKRCRAYRRSILAPVNRRCRSPALDKPPSRVAQLQFRHRFPVA